MRNLARIPLIAISALLAAGPAGALEIFNAIGDNPSNRGPSALAPGANDLHVYIDTANGGAPDPGADPAAACSGPGSDGTYTCATDFQYESTGDVEILGFTADAGRIAEVGPDYCVGFLADATHYRHNCGNPFAGENGVVKLGTLQVQVNGATGVVQMLSGQEVPTTLTTAPVSAAVLGQVLSCTPGTPGDLDCDGNPDGTDLCPHFPEADPAADANMNGRGDDCECGDQNGDGLINVNDILGINNAIFEQEPVGVLCDANNDGLCNVQDILAVNADIFSEGATSFCARHPSDP